MTTYSTGETIQSGDVVRVGKGKAEWTVMGIPGRPTRDGVTTGYHVSGPHRNMFIPADEHARLSLIRAWVPCGAVYDKHTHPFTCTLAPSDHTAHEDHKTDAPAVVCWEESPTDIPADYDPDVTYAEASAYVAEVAPEVFAAGEVASAYDPNTDGLPDPDNAREVAAWLAFTPTEQSARAAAVAMDAAFSEFDAKHVPEAEDTGDDIERCPVCGEPSDYCQGHGETGDPRGWRYMVAHDHGDHIQCHPAGCEAAGTSEHVLYPHHVGYLDSCFACTTGACVCCESDSLAPCVSDDCEAREFDDESEDTGEVDTYTGRDGNVYNASGPARGTAVGSIAERGQLGGFRTSAEPCVGESRPSFGGLAVVFAFLVSLAVVFGGLAGGGAPTAVAAPVSVAEVTEDSDAWNCATMGDHECGPRPAVAPTVPVHCLALPGRQGNTRYVMVAPVAGLVVGCEA
jgi:hypothetical protein